MKATEQNLIGSPPENPESELPLSPAVFHILLALADEERHGYGIMQEVKYRTDGQVHLVPGTLYGAIKRLLEKGIIEELDERPDPELNDERRRYYRLSDFGLKVLTAEAERLVLAAQGTDTDSNAWAAAQIALAQLESQRSQSAIALATLDLHYADASLGFTAREAIDAVRSQVLSTLRQEDEVLARLRSAMPD